MRPNEIFGKYTAFFVKFLLTTFNGYLFMIYERRWTNDVHFYELKYLDDHSRPAVVALLLFQHIKVTMVPDVIKQRKLKKIY